MDIDVRLALFRDMIGCCHGLYLWVYDSAFHPITSNCPEQAAVNDLFSMSHRQEDFDRQITAYNTPVIFTNELGLMWVMMPHFEAGELIRFYVLGPFFIDDIPPQNIKSQLNKYGLSILLRQEFLHFLRKLPIISLNRIFEYAIMLHFCVTGEKITVSDLRYYENKQQPLEPYIQRGRWMHTVPTKANRKCCGWFETAT